jgi:hypothetical protein
MFFSSKRPFSPAAEKDATNEINKDSLKSIYRIALRRNLSAKRSTAAT